MITHARILLKDTSVASAGTLPRDLAGLADESLADLAWTDPALGYRGFGFWPVDFEPAGAFDDRAETVDGETLSVESTTKRVTATPLLRPLTQEEIEALPPLPTPDPRVIGKGEFLDLFLAAGVPLSKIREASDDARLADFWFALNNFYTQIRRDHPSTTQGIGAMVAFGHVSQAQADAVLAGWPVE